VLRSFWRHTCQCKCPDSGQNVHSTVGFEESSHSQCLEVSQNAHSTLGFEMSRHFPNGETFQNQVSDERSVSCLANSRTFHATGDSGRSDSSVSEGNSVGNCGRQSSLKLCVINSVADAHRNPIVLASESSCTGHFQAANRCNLVPLTESRRPMSVSRQSETPRKPLIFRLFSKTIAFGFF
jgi:hypothetical protein